MIVLQLKMLLLLSLILLLSIGASKQQYLKEIVQSESALCLDGSPSLVYVSQGDPKKILLHFQSGGWCGEPTLSDTLESCYQRSLTSLGSSKYSPPTLTFSAGILSDSQPNYFSNWTKVFLGYCDGAGHQGSRLQPVKYKNTSLYFRGSNTTIERFEYLQKKYGLYSKTTQVVLSGASAGGLATYFWANYLNKKLINTKYFTIPDSGIFLNSPKFSSKKYDYLESFRILFSLSNSDADPPTPECLKKHPQQKHFCMLAENIIEEIQVPMFSVQSFYDAWSIQNILGLNCVSRYSLTPCSKIERNFIEEYRTNTSRVMEGIKKLKAKNGFWANGCVYHGYTFFSAYNSLSFRIPSGSAYSIDYCIGQWDKSYQNAYYEDEEEWPSNGGCSNKLNILTVE